MPKRKQILIPWFFAAGCMLLSALLAGCSDGKSGADTNGSDSDDTSTSGKQDSSEIRSTDSSGAEDDSDSSSETGTDAPIELQPNWTRIPAKGTTPAENGVYELAGFESIFVTENDVLLARVSQGQDDIALWRSTDKGVTWQKLPLNLIPQMSLQSGRIIAFEVPEPVEEDTDTTDTEDTDTLDTETSDTATIDTHTGDTETGDTETGDTETVDTVQDSVSGDTNADTANTANADTDDTESEAPPIRDTDPVSFVVSTSEPNSTSRLAKEHLRVAMYSDDDGATWHLWQEFEITDVTQQEDGTVYITAWSELYRSHDDGATVTPVSTSLYLMDAIGAAANGWLFMHTLQDDFIGLKSADGGKNWIKTDEDRIPVSAPDGSLLVGLNRSIDMGETWDSMAQTNAENIVLLPTGALLGGRAEFFYASNNYGQSWVRTDSPRPDLFWASWTAIAMLSDGTVLASGFGGFSDEEKLGLYSSAMFMSPNSFGKQITSNIPTETPVSCFDGELTEDVETRVDCGGVCGPCDTWWYMAHRLLWFDSLQSLPAGCMFVTSEGRLFADSHHSDDNGRTWSIMDAVVDCVVLEHNGTLYGTSMRREDAFGSDDDIFVTLYASYDKGDTWMSLGELEHEGTLDRLMVDTAGTMYMRRTNKDNNTSFSLSRDGGWTWYVIHNGADNSRYMDLFVTPQGDAVILHEDFNGSGSALYRYPQGEGSIDREDEPFMQFSSDLVRWAYVTGYNTYLVKENGYAMFRITDSGPEQIDLPGIFRPSFIHEMADGDIVVEQGDKIYYAPRWGQWENRNAGIPTFENKWVVNPAVNQIYAFKEDTIYYTADLNTW